MGKLLLLVLAVIAGWLLVKGLFKSRGVGDVKPGESVQSREKMIKCDRCGVFMPESESMSLDGKLTCRAPERCMHRQSA